MAFKHGIFYNEVATSLVPTLSVNQPTVVVGTCAAHLALKSVPVNTPFLCSTYSEFVRYFGYSGDFENFTLDEAAYVHFTLYGVKPLVVINVLDPARHTKSGSRTLSSGLTKAIELEVKALLGTLEVKSGETALKKDTDYTASYENGKLIFRILNQEKVSGSVTLNYEEPDASKVTIEEIIGAVDAATDSCTGLECISEVYPKYGMVPGCLIVPKYSTNAEVAQVMATKVKNINGCFNAVALADIDTGTVKTYRDCAAYKNDNSLIDKDLVVCWPMVTLGGKSYHLSTHLAAFMSRVDADNDNVPFESPSNKILNINGLCLKSGREVNLTKDRADYLNSVGVMTAVNLNGHRAWGNRTSIYPTTTDSKDVFLCVRRMIHFLGTNIITTFFSHVDKPMNRRLIETVENSVQRYLDGLTASQAILGGRIEFLEDENPITDLIDGKILFHLMVGFCVPAEEISFDIEFDPSYYAELFD